MIDHNNKNKNDDNNNNTVNNNAAHCCIIRTDSMPQMSWRGTVATLDLNAALRYRSEHWPTGCEGVYLLETHPLLTALQRHIAKTQLVLQLQLPEWLHYKKKLTCQTAFVKEYYHYMTDYNAAW